MTTALAGRVALVTGASRGLGFAWASALAAAGARVLLLAEATAELTEAHAALERAGHAVDAIEADLRLDDSFAWLVDRLGALTDRLDVLVNNAGVLHRAPIDQASDESWHETLSVNLTAPFRLIRGLLPRMRRDGGSIVNVSSRAGREGFAGQAAYCASKFGIEGLTQAVAGDLRGSRISVNTLTPGLRIKPTGITVRQARTLAEEARRAWHDPLRLSPALVTLAMLRGEVTGLRFDALRLTHAVEQEGFPLSPERLAAVAE